MNRRAFAAMSGAFACIPSAARATGGLDVAGPAAGHVMRVLLASGRFDQPQSIDAWHFAWNGHTYRGAFATARLPDGQNGLVNTVPIDAYLYGVLGSEISPSWPAAAQEAQAIVSRTYALGRLRPERVYDVVASESDQHYGGIEGESVQGRAAVDATGGTIVTFAGLPAHVAYGSCCGGKTAAAVDVWKIAYPYLPSIVDPHCVGTPNYLWQADVALGALDGPLGPPFASIGAARAVTLGGASDPNDRPRTIAFDGESGSFETTLAAFRAAAGATVVRSTFVRVATLGRDARLSLQGTGRGHGVGMCQWGARAMADDGAAARDIIAFYLPGTSLGRG